MRPPVDDIPAPPFPAKLPWLNVAPLRMDKQRGRPVLIEFWDFCRVNSLRTLPYLQGVARALRGRRPARDRRAHRRLRARRGRGERPRAPSRAWRSRTRSCIDPGFELWTRYGNEGWPARYLWDGDGHLVEPLRRGRLRRDRARDPGAAGGRARAGRRRCTPRTTRRAHRGADARPARRLQRTVRGGRCVGRAGRDRRRCTSTASGSPCSGPVPTCSSSTPTTPTPCSTLEVGAGVTCHATCFTPGVVLPGA